MLPNESHIKLDEFPLGGRLLIRSKKDWRVAVISRKTEEYISLSIASPSGHCYRVRRAGEVLVNVEGGIPYMTADGVETWRENFTVYDSRW